MKQVTAMVTMVTCVPVNLWALFIYLSSLISTETVVHACLKTSSKDDMLNRNLLGLMIISTT